MTGRYRLAIMLPLLLAAGCAPSQDNSLRPTREGTAACAPGGTAAASAGCSAPAAFDPLETGAAEGSNGTGY